VTDAVNAVERPLDDVMLAMDVVDTLRRRRRLVDKELNEEASAEDLKERLRKIYKAQGIEVSDEVLEQGVAALREDRFTYKPPSPNLAIRLAGIYVSRARWGKWLGGGLAAVLIAWGAWWYSVSAPLAALPDDLKTLQQQVTELAREPRARERGDELLAGGRAALRDGDEDQARQALASLTALRATLEQAYTIQVVARPGEKSGVWRIPDVNTRTRNYYLIVEAVDADGRVVPVMVVNEETRRSERVEQWGLRVDEAKFNAVAADKRDDGIIQDRRVGSKALGRLQPSYDIKTTGRR